MFQPKSTPDLNIQQTCRRSSREVALHRNSKQLNLYQFRIQNPFHGTLQQKIIPTNILNQIEQLQYISTKSIKNMEIPQTKTKRVSGFVKNLQMMQQLAKRQEQKYTGMIKQGKQHLSRKHVQFNTDQKNISTNANIYQNMNLNMNININDDDKVSLQLNGFYNFSQRIQDDFSIFEKDDNYNYNENYYGNCGGSMDQENPIIFYSNKEIEAGYYGSRIDEELNDYLQ